MKRSEMVEILKASVITHMNCGYECCNTDDKMYSKILELLEKAGMKPPTVYGKAMPMGYDGRTGEVAAWDVSGNPVQAWEHE